MAKVLLKRPAALFFTAAIISALAACARGVSPLPAQPATWQSTLSNDAVLSPDATTQKLYAVRLSENSLDSYTLWGTQSSPTLSWVLPASGDVDANGKIYVANRNHSDSITIYASNGKQINPTIGHLQGAVGVAVDQYFKIWALNANGTVTTYLSNGTKTTPTIKGLISPTSIAVDRYGSIYITEAGTANDVVRYSNFGIENLKITDSIKHPLSVAIDGGGRIYVLNGRTSPTNGAGNVTTYSSTGLKTSLAIGNLHDPVSVTVDANENVYVTRAYQSAGASSGVVDAYSPGGTLTGSFFPQTNQMGAFHSATLMPGGALAVFADTGVMAFALDGTRLPLNITGNVFASGVDNSGNIHAAVGPSYRIETYSSAGVWASSFYLPAAPSSQIGGAAFDGNGNAYVAYTTLKSFRAYDPTGKQLFAITPPANNALGAVSVKGGKVYVLNGGSSGSVTAFTFAGAVTVPAVHNLAFPTALTVDANGKIYVGLTTSTTSGSVVTYDKTGAASTPTITGLPPIAGLAVANNGNIYVSAGGAVRVYSNTGTLLSIHFTGLNDAGAISIH